jgi:hypothetical protein
MSYVARKRRQREAVSSHETVRSTQPIVLVVKAFFLDGMSAVSFVADDVGRER